MKFERRDELIQLTENLKYLNELMKNGILTDQKTNMKYFTGYSYNTLYDWDQYFESIVQIYMGWDCEHIKNGVLIFLENQMDDGLIPRHIPDYNFYMPTEHVKPFLAQIALLVIENYDEKDWILNKNAMSKLKKYLDYWLFEMDKDKNGLSEWWSAPHTGMDNQHERAGYWGDGFCEGVDLNCYLVRECKAFARLSALFGDHIQSQQYSAYAEKRKNLINQLLWCEEDGIYYDRNMMFDKQGELSPKLPWASTINSMAKTELIKVKSISCFAPIFCEVANQQQVDRLVNEHLLNPDEFWSSYPVRTLAKTEPWYSQVQLPADLGCNWRATTWIPTNYMLIHGLNRYGKKDVAGCLAFKTNQLVKKAGDREWYSTDSGTGCGLDPFYGWSVLGHFVEWEIKNGIDLTRI